MDEGKPTKPKWWSRPRTHVPDPAPADTVSAGDGDFELEKPAGAGARQAPDGVADGVSAPAPGERPRPLHDPDPYSTPPYGGPGPWAPAPPVRHPGTPAHGTATGDARPGPAPGAGGPTTTALPPPPRVSGAQGAPGAELPAGYRAAGVLDGVPQQGAPASVTHAFARQPAEGHEPVPSGAVSPAPVADGAPARAPWQNYDPWAAAPFRHHGVAVGSPGGRRGRTGRALVLGAVLLALASGGVGGAVGAYLERNGGIDDVRLPQAGAEPRGRAPDSVAGIAASALPSVVTLHVSGSGSQGTGTGFVLDRRGHILTNNHVVDPADGGGGITVTFSGGETAKAEVVGHDSGYDLAVVKVTGVSGLRPLSLGNSDNVQVGDPVVAIGAPFDLENTVTAGIISAKERPITAGGEESDGSDISYVDALQTDAPINPGNSGGPLVDSRARVIGINSAIRSADSGSDLEGGQSGSIGLGFAIPINQGKRVAEELINTGRATHPVIGVTLDMEYGGDGARVGTEDDDGGPPVSRGGPGAEAGIRAGDVITEVDGQRVRSGEELIVKTRSHRPGDRLELTLERDGKEERVTLVLGSADGG
ncbi:putative serine protease PepD [Streptomyces sp. V3I8]|uniref:trypsin-like peptidase domain-containing protein n=1 Tax=Streptomyces sp. V3I8 TaxID=3042279 RepID=UPI00277F586F|nr:trypsin-like peptidase domain-containing protein [Streptomyces sp. V3I8]MDQ1036325.1 putative serine protease PepD [Streptomyces sp. V3I8]